MASTSRVPARFTLAHGLMVLAGLMTFVLVATALKDGSAKVEVLAAAGDFNAGEVQTTIVLVDADDPLLAAFAKPGDYSEGMFVRRQLAKGDPILLSDLVRAAESDFPRTFNFETTPTQLQGLEVIPGDLVDVIGVDETGAVVYVAIGRPVVRIADSAPTALGGVRVPHITIGVSDLDAVRISAAWRMDDLHLVRSTGAAATDPSLTMDRPQVNLSLLQARRLQQTRPDDPIPTGDTGALAPATSSSMQEGGS